MYKLMVSDLDETLLRDDGSISDANVAAIKAAAKLGVKFVPNTGRGFASVQALLKILGTYDEPDQYVISYNGGAVVENKNNEVILTDQLPYEHAKQIFDLMYAHPEIGIHVYTLHTLYLYHAREDDLKYLASRGVEYKIMTDNDFSIFRKKHIMKVIFMQPDLDARHAIAEPLYEQVKDFADMTYSSNQYAEFNAKGVNKGTATMALAKKLGLTADEVIAFGDNSNDLPMLRKVGMPVSVANGIPAVKDVAKLVTTADYEDGVAEAIHKLILDK